MRWLFRFFNSSAVRARDVVGAVVINGNVSDSSIVIQHSDAGPLPEMPILPWYDLRAVSGSPQELEIFNLLTWRSRLVDKLIGRDVDQEKLIAWARDDRPVAIRFLSGAGGSGKSRLAAEVAATLRDEAWSTGQISLNGVSKLPMTRKGLFVFIDYPEAHRPAVRAILQAASRLENPPTKIRLLLLSRQPMSWWREEIVAADASEHCDTQESSIGPLDAASTCRLVHSAATGLAELQPGATVPMLDDGVITTWYRRRPDLHGLPLFATAAAVHAVLDPAPAFNLAGTEIIEALVTRERKRLNQAAANWPEPEAASRLHGLAALRDTLNDTTIKRLARLAPDIGLPKAERVIDAVRAQSWWIDGQLQAPQPDIVAAELLYQILGQQPDAASGWLASVLETADAIGIERLERLAHDMATLHDQPQNRLVDGLVRAVKQDPSIASTWRSILDSSGLSFRLAPLGAVIGQALLALPDTVDKARAPILNNLSNRLSDAGDWQAALAAIREATDIRRRLAEANPARFEPDLALSLNNLSNRLSDTGDWLAALTAIREAADIYRRLAKANPARFEPDLALSLNNLSNRLGDAGDWSAALMAIREAGDIYRRLSDANPARFERHLALNLNNLSNQLGHAGDGPAALAAIHESADIYRRLAAANPARFEPDLAMSLNNLSNRLSEAGDVPAALTAIREAADIRRRLATANPARFEPDLALNLNNLSNRLSNSGDVPAALAAIREAVDIRRRLAIANPARFEPDLATSLNNLSNRLSEAGDVPAALVTIREAIDIRRRLAIANPARFEPDLASSLNNLCNRLSNAGDVPAALAAIREVGDIYRRLADANPARFEPYLKMSVKRLNFLQDRDSA